VVKEGYIPAKPEKEYAATDKASAVFQKLQQAGDALMSLIRRSKGRDNKTLTAFTEAVNELLKKFEF
jgi:hypothetical protein